MRSRPKWMSQMVGHFWTVGPALWEERGGKKLPGEQQWMEPVENEFGEPILRSGAFVPGEDEESLVVILHGLGGTTDRSYCVRAARAAQNHGVASLRLALRGSDGLGEDLHHAGFVDDLAPILARPPFDRFQRVALVGFSLGGAVALHAAGRSVEPRIAAVAAVCPPLDLPACQRQIDRPASWPYRHYLLRALKATYPLIALGGGGRTPPERVAQAMTLREWDRLTVVPRFGFSSVDEYYRTQSSGPVLAQLEVPGLVVVGEADPIVPATSLRGHLVNASDAVTVRWVRDGGHVFFDPSVTLGISGATPGVEAQVVAWVKNRLSERG